MRNKEAIGASLKKEWFKKNLKKTNPIIYENKNFFNSQIRMKWKNLMRVKRLKHILISLKKFKKIKKIKRLFDTKI